MGRDLERRLVATPSAWSFGAVAGGNSAQKAILLKNTGELPTLVKSLSFLYGGAGTSEAFTVALDGQVYGGGTGTVLHTFTTGLSPGESIPAVVTFSPEAERYDSVVLRFQGNFGSLDVPVDGLGGHEGSPFLHVVIDGPETVVDYDGDGSELVQLDGSQSHTHEPGRVIAAYEWSMGGAPFATDPEVSATLALGTATVDLEIRDDGSPPKTLIDHIEIDVVDSTVVPDVLALYYDASGGSASALLDAVPANADFAETLVGMTLPAGGQVGSSTLDEDVMVRLVADVTLTTSGTYDFTAIGGVGRRLQVNGFSVTGPIFLSAGTYAIEARFAVDNAWQDLPLDVLVSFAGGAAAPLDPETLTHDESTLLPVINSMPDLGIASGGNTITIDGMGFFPASTLSVHWGGQELTLQDFESAAPGQIVFFSPPGAGTIQVTVETDAGISNPRSFSYSTSGPVPVDFDLALTVPLTDPTSATWGPDGRLYVTSRYGNVTALDFADDWSSAVKTTYPGVSGLSNGEALGITVNPFDPPSPVRLYVSHTKLYQHGGGSFTGPSPYPGQVSTLDGPDFDAPVPLVTGLPTSNHDHAPNGIVHDNNGDLYIAAGSSTNAGVKHPNHGDLPESPLSAAILKALTSKPGFNGAITYLDSATGLPSDDQVYGEVVDVAPGVDVIVQGPGLRNPFDIAYTTKGRLYATDNGPNIGFGARSTSMTTENPDPYDDDELNLIEFRNYYGHPNRSRGRYDTRQNVYRGSLAGPASMPGEFKQMVGWLPPSSDGIDEYRSGTFMGQIRGRLVVQEFLGDPRLVKLSIDGRATTGHTVLDVTTGALGVITGPGGAIIALDYLGGQLKVLVPDDLSAVGLVTHDITPWRAPATGGHPFTIGGVGFGDLSNTTVTIGGSPAMLSSVSATRIEGTVPPEFAPTTDMLDVVVTVGGNSSTLPAAFRYLLPKGTEPGFWEGLSILPLALGEVAAGVVDGRLYVVGEGSNLTLVYDLITRQWQPPVATRPAIGHHHGAEVVDGKLYLVGGLGGGSEGKLQIYDPGTDSWSFGANMPWLGGSVSTCEIGGLIYAAGGIVGTSSVKNCAVYDPAMDSWTTLSSMPLARNHTAAGTDGQKFWIFGGRTGGNWVGNGHAHVFVYDPVLDDWDYSDAPSSPLVPLPQYRGGMGKAVFYRGEFYVFGGETLDGPGAVAGNVYDRVDVYDPIAHTWRLEAPMRSPRHGIFPVLFESRIYLPGGGTQAGNSQSKKFDVFSRQ